MGSFGDAFIAEELSGLLEQMLIPGSSQSRAARQASCRNSGKEFCPSNAIGTVGCANGRHIMFGNWICVPEINP